MTFDLILAVIKSVADTIRGWFVWTAGEEKKKKDAIDKTTSKIGKGKPFAVLLLLFLAGCSGYVYTVSTPIAFDANDFQMLEPSVNFIPPKKGYYFSLEASETWVRSKIAEYEIRKRGFFHKEKIEE
jgi:hypothetical protein